MATTIKLKNGSGAPLAGDLVQGEPALDLTNKRLYTENASGTVIEVGTNPTSLTTGTFTSTGIDDNATSTAITIDSSQNVGIGTSNATPSNGEGLCIGSGSTITRIDMRNTTTGDATGDGTSLQLNGNNFTIENREAGYVAFSTSLTERMRIDSSGRLFVGTTDTPSSSNVKQVLAKTGDCYLQIASGATGGGLLGQNGANMLFYTYTGAVGSESYAERMRIDGSGNVGINTTNPLVPLHVETSGTSTTIGDNAAVTLRSKAAGRATTLQFSDGANANWISALSGNLGFATNNTERMRIDSSGRVGIGTTSPTALFTLSSSSNTEINIIDGTRTSKIFTQNGGRDLQIQANQDLIINASGGTNVGIGTSSPSEKLHVKTSAANTTMLVENSSSQARYAVDTDGPYIYALTSGDSALRVFGETTERMRIDSSGNLLVGTTSANALITADNASNTGNTLLSLKDSGGTGTHTQISFNNTNGQVGTINTSGTATSYNTSSDQRLKENIVDAPAGNIDDIRIRSFDWKADGSHQTYGVIAQELVEVAPEAVTQSETWGVDYSKLVPMMIKEIQDLKAEVAALKGA